MSAAPSDHKLRPLAESPLSDEEVVQRVLAGDTPLYEILMRRYNRRIFRVVRAILLNDHEAEDVMQDAYVRAYAALHQFAGRASFSTWLTRIAIHEALHRLNRRKREAGLPACADQPTHEAENLKSPGPDPERQMLSNQAASFLEQAVDALPETYRSVFVLREIEGMNTSETAACLELTEETVKIRLLRARQALRKELYTLAGATTSQAFVFLGERCDRVVAGVFERLAELDRKRASVKPFAGLSRLQPKLLRTP